MKRFALFLVLLMTALSLFGCGKTKKYTHAELEIELPKQYTEYNGDESFDLAFSDGYAVIGVNRISFVAGEATGIPSYLDEAGFAEYYRGQIEKETTEISSFNGVPYFSYEREISGKEYTVLISFYRSKYAHFTVMFIVDSSLSGDYLHQFIDYIDNVSFNPDK